MSHKDKEFSAGERIYLGTEGFDADLLRDHFDRYEFAKKYLRSEFVVVDAACGTGYGSDMIAGSCAKVIGLEISDHALAWAREHHGKANIDFKKADLNGPLDLPDAFADVVISFETLEHVENQAVMIGEFKRILKPGGLLLISSPDREIITEKAHLKNKFHINELSKKEFVVLLRRYFTIDGLYAQGKFNENKQPRYRRVIKNTISAVDVFRLRPKIVDMLGLTSVVHKHFSSAEETPIEQVDIDSANDFFVLVGVCRKN